MDIPTLNNFLTVPIRSVGESPVQRTESKTTPSTAVKTLLLVGPKPPPIGGGGLTVQAILDELAIHYPSIRLKLINTSPARNPKKDLDGFNFEKVRRILLMVPKYIWAVGKSDSVVVLPNNLFACTAVPFMILFARFFRKSFYLKPIG